MIDLKLNKKRLGMHWHYYRWRYVIILAVALAAANFLFSATKPQAPADRKVDIVMIGNTTFQDNADVWSKAILQALPPDQLEVNVTTTPLVEGQESTIYQLVGARMAASEGYIWIMSKDMFASFAASGAFRILDDEISSFDIPQGTDLSAGRVDVRPDESQPAVNHLCGIPLDKCPGLSELFLPEGMVMAFPVYADKNYGNTVIAANWLLHRTDQPHDVTDAAANQKVGITILAHSFKARSAGAWQADMLKALGADQKEVNIRLNPYHVGRESYSAGTIAADIKAGRGSAWIVPQDVFLPLAQAGVLLPLDGDIASFKIPEGTDLKLGQAAVVQDGKAGEVRQYGIPLDKCAGLSRVTVPDGMMLVFPSWKKLDFNYANAKAAANWLLTADEPPEAEAAK